MSDQPIDWAALVDRYFAEALADAPHLATADDPNVELCTVAGVRHDMRLTAHTDAVSTRTSWACVWCNAVACGWPSQADPCLEAHHHRGPHRSHAGVTWPIGGDRP